MTARACPACRSGAVAEVERMPVERIAGAWARQEAWAGPDQPFGCIALFQVIEHLEVPDEVFEATGVVAAPDARLLPGCPADRRYTRRVRHPERIGRSDLWDYPPQHLLRWRPDALRIFLGRHSGRLQTAQPPVRHRPPGGGVMDSFLLCSSAALRDSLLWAPRDEPAR